MVAVRVLALVSCLGLAACGAAAARTAAGSVGSSPSPSASPTLSVADKAAADQAAADQAAADQAAADKAAADKAAAEKAAADKAAADRAAADQAAAAAAPPQTITGSGSRFTAQYTLLRARYRISWTVTGNGHFVAHIHGPKGPYPDLVDEYPPNPSSGQVLVDSPGGDFYLEIEASSLTWRITLTGA